MSETSTDVSAGAGAATVPAPHTFEQAMERLEEIVGQMENSKLPLEDLIRCYEEGTRLVKVCNERLTAAEGRIEMIAREAVSPGEPSFEQAVTGAAAQPIVKDPNSTQDASVPPARSAKKNNEVSLF